MKHQPFSAILDAQFEVIFEAMPVPVLVMQPDAPNFTIIAINSACCTALHTRRETVTGRSVFDVFPGPGMAGSPENKARLSGSLALVSETLQTHNIPSVKYEPAAEDGLPPKYWQLTSAPVKAPDDTLRYILLTLRDITEETLSHTATAVQPCLEDTEESGAYASAAYLHQVIDGTQTAIFVFNPVKNEAGDVIDFRFSIANRMLATYVGRQPDELIGTLGSDWLPAYKTNGLFDCFADTYLTGNANRLNFHYNADHIDVWLDITSARINDQVLVTFSDYTPLKQMQQKMESSLTELKRSNHNLEEFAYIASHDLQEPLRKIKAFGDILSKRYAAELDREGGDIIRRIQSAAERMRYLIEDLLTFSRISYQKSNFQEVQPAEVIRGVLTDLEPSIKEKQARISIGELLPFAGDPSQMRQLFQNLISNALKFSRSGTPPEIDIRSEVVSGQDCGFELEPEVRKEQFQLITVKDNGIGFEQQYAEKIFQIFQRLHGRSEYPGTGVGLSIVQKVIALHHGYIRAESEPGKGATFRILLPYKQG